LDDKNSSFFLNLLQFFGQEFYFFHYSNSGLQKKRRSEMGKKNKSKIAISIQNINFFNMVLDYLNVLVVIFKFYSLTYYLT